MDEVFIARRWTGIVETELRATPLDHFPGIHQIHVPGGFFPEMVARLDVEILERPVLHQLGIQPAIRPVVDVLEKKAVEIGAEFDRRLGSVNLDLHRRGGAD